jgi:hypothetical protein
MKFHILKAFSSSVVKDSNNFLLSSPCYFMAVVLIHMSHCKADVILQFKNHIMNGTTDVPILKVCMAAMLKSFMAEARNFATTSLA